jgi:hypothetical protein
MTNIDTTRRNRQASIRPTKEKEKIMTHPSFKATYFGTITASGQTIKLPYGYYWAKPGAQSFNLKAPGNAVMRLMYWEKVDPTEIAQNHPHFHQVDASNPNLPGGFYHVEVTSDTVGDVVLDVYMPY